jgi:hypothetical protein
VPENAVYQCIDEVIYEDPSFGDNCDNNLTVQPISGIIPNPNGCGYTIARSWTATDNCGNSFTVSQGILVEDTTPPVLHNIPANITAECDQLPSPPTNVYATDNCDDNVTVSYEQTGEIVGCYANIIRTWTATDACGNTTSESQIIVVGDTTPPTIICPEYIIVGCTEEVPAPDVTLVETYDNCSAVTVEFVSDASGQALCVNRYVITRTYKATDACGNISYCTQQIGVYDNQGPELLQLPDSIISCSYTGEPQQPLFVDNCGGQFSITYEDIPAEEYDIEACGQYTTFSKGGWGEVAHGNNVGVYRDANFASAFPSGITIGCATGSFTFTSSLAIQNWIPSGGGAAVLPAGNMVDPSSATYGQNFADQLMAAMLNVGFDYYDPNFAIPAGNLGDLIFASGPFAGMTVNDVIQIANDVIGGCSNTYSPTTLSAAMEDINLSFHEGNTNTGDLICDNQSNLCNQEFIRVWQATDLCGNSTSVQQPIVITDNDDPTVIYVPADATYECDEEVPMQSPIFDDNCDDDLTIIYVTDTVNFECGYEILRAWRAIDDCGNYVIASQTISIIDTTPPVVDPYEVYQVVQCEYEGGLLGITAHDNCSDVTITYEDFVYSGSCLGDLVRTYYVTDWCGNLTIVEQIISQVDTIAPVIINPADYTIECDNAIPTMPEIEIYDGCGYEVEVLATEDIVILDSCTYQLVWHWTATDICNNIAEATTIITVTDTTAPYAINAPEEEIWVQCLQDVPDFNIEFEDNCD